MYDNHLPLIMCLLRYTCNSCKNVHSNFMLDFFFPWIWTWNQSLTPIMLSRTQKLSIHVWNIHTEKKSHKKSLRKSPIKFVSSSQHSTFFVREKVLPIMSDLIDQNLSKLIRKNFQKIKFKTFILLCFYCLLPKPLHIPHRLIILHNSLIFQLFPPFLVWTYICRTAHNIYQHNVYGKTYKFKYKA